MRLSILLCMITFVCASASESYSQETKITLNLPHTTVRKALDDIKQQTQFSFWYRSEDIDLDKAIAIVADKQDVRTVLNQVLVSQNLSYTIDDKHIIIYKKTEQEPSSSQQQGKRISGNITDTNGEPIIGANVMEKGVTRNGTLTDVNGNFNLTVSPGATLTISYIGYSTKEVTVGNQTSFSIVLDENALGLDEVVVIGYGTVRRADLTGSVASVTGAQLKDIPVTSASLAIVGRMPGVQVTKTEGSPDAEIKIRVRGGGSLTQDNSPLFIVDGFPVDNINDIAPTDIASIDILKDASSTAIYGARGANGVVIITTKSGSEGKAKVSYNMYYGVKNITKKLDVLNPYEYVLWQHETLGASAAERYFGDYKDFDLYKEMKGTNWQEEIFGRTGTSLYNNVSVSGGSKVSRYNISLTRNDEEEIMLGSGYDRTNLTIKTSYDIKSWLKIDLNTRLSNYNLKGAGTGNIGGSEQDNRLVHIIRFRPINGLSDYVDGDLVDESDFEATSTYVINPLQQTQDDYQRRNQFFVNIGSAAEFKIMEGLTYRVEYGTQFDNSKNNRFYGLHTSNSLRYGEQPLAEIRQSQTKSYRVANIATYRRRNLLPGHNLTVMLGEELNSLKTYNLTSSVKYLPKYIDAVSAFGMMNLGAADPLNSEDRPDNKTSSFFGRLNYDYKGKYLLSATLRADGSSKFAQGHQWGYFPSAGLAWRISDESFMKPTTQWLSNLKARFSYGAAGNNRISDNAWKKTYSVATGNIFMDGNETSRTPFLQPGTILSNPRLKWETTITRNAGVDFGFFKQRLNGTVEVYKNTTKDLLMQGDIPTSTGYSTQWQNIGQTSNRGLEITIEGIIINRKDFLLSASFNIGFNKNNVDDLGPVDQLERSTGWSGGPSGDFLVKVGQPVGLMYGYVTEGIYSFDDFIYDDVAKTYTLKAGVSDNRALVNPSRFWPGTLKLKNQDDDLIVNANDKVVIGNANPKHTGGFNLTAQYKGLDCSAFFNWVYGNDIYNANKIDFTSYNAGRPFKNLLGFMNIDNRYSYFNRETGSNVTNRTDLEELNKNKTMWSAAMSTNVLHSWAVEDGSFLRLNNVTLGYSLPQALLKRIRCEQVRIYITGYNLWTWTNYTGYDPEVDTRRSSPLTPGVDWCAYPRSRTYNIGANITF